MDLLEKLIDLRKTIDKIDKNKWDWPRETHIQRIQRMCPHKHVAELDSTHVVCEICGKEMVRAPKGAKIRQTSLAEYINTRDLQGNIVELSL
jgi:hypothetical protein